MHVLDDPVACLRRYLLPRTIEEAQEYLGRRLETATLFSVCARHCPGAFRRRFPKEWVTDQNSLLPSDKPYSAGELKCLDLIAEEVFPFAEEYLEEVSRGEGQRMDFVPLYSYGVDFWSDGLQEMNGGWTMLALLNRDIEGAKEHGMPACVCAALKKAKLFAGQAWSVDIFKATCAPVVEPLRFLPVAIQMLDHDTGNLFLDPTDETPVTDAQWTLSDLEMLAREWREAKVMQSQADHLTKWLERTPTHFRKVVDLWNLALWNMLMQEPNRNDD